MGISIKEPCHEDWTKMTPSQKGAFCQSCAIDVIDFTNKTPIEIKQLLIQEFSQNSRTCGRITNYQLDQLNDEFFQWKSEKETFRAIWMFSLLAVFGLTLFSCQNTLSKEMISKLNSETSMVLNQDSLKTDLAITTDSIDTNIDTKQNLAVKLPNFEFPVTDIIVTTGVMPHYEIIPWITCEMWLGDFVVSGSITAEPESKQFLVATSPLSSPLGTYERFQNQPINPIKNPHPTNNLQKADGIVGPGNKKFEAFVSPNPITQESRLFVHALESISLSIGIHMNDNPEAIRTGSIELSAGHHSLDLKLSSLNGGQYTLRLFAFNQLSELTFDVPMCVS